MNREEIKAMNALNTLPAVGFLRQRHIIGKGRGGDGLLPISAATFWRWIGAGKFPKPVKLGAHTSAWRVEDVKAWIAQHSEENKATGEGAALPQEREGKAASND
jgi:predicted DNA-binding transcriptional regulator AlpA